MPGRPDPKPQAGRRATRWAALALTVASTSLAAAACSADGSELSADDFRAGVCRDSAAAILEVQETVQQLNDDPEAVGAARSVLEQRQKELRTNREQADGELRDHFTDLTNAIGYLRISIDADTFRPAQTEDVSAALDRVVTACTDE